MKRFFSTQTTKVGKTLYKSKRTVENPIGEAKAVATDPFETLNSNLRLTEDDMKVYIDYKKYAFPEVNPVSLTSISEGKAVTLANYRYPSLTGKRKGIIYFQHEYGQYCQRMAYLGLKFALNGYDFVGFDQKGFGYSEGERGIMESVESVMQDCNNHIDLIEERFNHDLKKCNRFLLGYSFGGYLSTQLSQQRKDFFSAMGLLSPFFQFLNPDKFAKFDHTLEKLNATHPTRKIMLFPMKPLPSRHKLHFILDQIGEGKELPVRNLMILKSIPQSFTPDKYSQIDTPFITFIGEKEQVVCNKAIEQFYQTSSAKIKEIIRCHDQDHFIVHDWPQLDFIVNKTCQFFSQFN